jgi:tetratricopeptide (TPR) repeat protein
LDDERLLFSYNAGRSFFSYSLSVVSRPMSDADSPSNSPENHPNPPTPLRRVSIWPLVGVGGILILAAAAIAVSFWRANRSQFAYINLAPSPEATSEVADLLTRLDGRVRELVEELSPSVATWDLMAQMHRRFGDAAVAKQAWQECLRLEPDFVPALVALGSLAAETGDHAAAEQYYRDAIQIDPASSTLPVSLAQALLDQGKVDKAAEVLEDEFRRHPNSVPMLTLLAQAHLQLKEYRRACDLAETLIGLAPEMTSAYYTLAQAWSKRGHPDKAKTYLVRFRELKDKDEQRHRDDLKRFDDLEAVQTAVAQLETSVALIWLDHNNSARAEEVLRDAAELGPDATRSLLVLAWLYQQRGRSDEAFATLAEAERRGQDDLECQLQLGQLYSEAGQFPAAERAYRRAIALTPNQAGGYAALANLYVQANHKVDEAAMLAAKAIELEPTARYFWILSLSLQRMGDLPRATTALERAIELEPDNPDYQQALDALAEQP